MKLHLPLVRIKYDMKKLFRIRPKFSLSDFERLAVAKEESGSLLGGYKEYKPTIYDHEYKGDKASDINNLLGGSEETE